MVLGRGQSEGVLAVAQGEKARLLAVEEFLHHDLISRRAEGFFRHHDIHGGLRLLRDVADEHALAGSQPVGLDHQRAAFFADKGLGLCGVSESAIGGGGDVVTGAEILHEALGAFQSGSRHARTEALDSNRIQPVHQPRHQRCLGPHHHVVRIFLAGQGEEPVHVLGPHVHASSKFRHAGIAGRADQFVAEGRGSNGPG